MPLSTGERVGSYQILASIGTGGMGEVYRARDTKLKRDVAVKVLPDQMAADPDRMMRFQREAEVLASLNHPNIAHIYGVEERALVMELVEGESPQGPMAFEDAWKIASQIADALEYAHERGVIHRDLKPANIKVTPEGVVKLLDFGLAKAFGGTPDPISGDPAKSPTATIGATVAGTILGTAAYMSPEQARGKPVDKRADIWAFGVVLYEILTGRRLFQGEDLTDTLASVVKDQPDLSAAPAKVRRLLERCLEKDPKRRLRDIGDGWQLLEDEKAPAVSARSRALPIVASLSLPLAIAGWLAFLYLRPKPAAAPVQRFTITPPGAFDTGVLSPDGTMLLFSMAFQGQTGQLWLRRLDSLETHPLEGTTGARGVPFWSPDSRFIGFSNDRNKLVTINLSDGSSQVVCDSGDLVLGGFWTADGKIVFGDPSRAPGLFEVSATGGTASALPGTSQQIRGGWPVLLPDGRHFVYSQVTAGIADAYLGSLDDKGQSSKKLLTGSGLNAVGLVPLQSNPDLVYLLFLRQFATRGSYNRGSGTLTAQPFDLHKMELTGEAITLAEQVSTFSASRTGILVYRNGGLSTARRLTLLDRQGKVVGTVGEPGDYTSEMVFSPDAKRLVATRRDSGNSNLWVFDLARGIGTRFTSGSVVIDAFPAWSPDGSRIAFASLRDGQYLMFQKLSNGGGDEELLLKMDGGALPLSWSGDGSFLFLGNANPLDALTWVLPLAGNFHASGKPYIFVKKGLGIDERFSPGAQGHPRWVAYQSNESGRFEVYVRPFDPNSRTGVPPGSGVWQVSTSSGVSPRWSGNGKELLYMAQDANGGTVMSVDVSGDTEFQFSAPKPLFKPQGWISDRPDAAYWDVTPDGKRFLFAIPQAASAGSAEPSFTVVLNWTSLLKK